MHSKQPKQQPQSGLGNSTPVLAAGRGGPSPYQHPAPKPQLCRCSLGADPRAPGLDAQQGALLNDCLAVTQALGILEPLTGEHIPPEALLIQGPNWRESLVGNGLLSRNRAVL